MKYAPIFDSIIESSLWEEEPHVFKLFIMLLPLQDTEHIVRLDDFKLWKRSQLTEEQFKDALKVLSSPDTKRLEFGPQDFEGRRIERVEGGWRVLNGPKYQKEMQRLNRLASNRESQARYRAKTNGKIDNKKDLIRQHRANAKQHLNHAAELEKDTTAPY